jgi:hypothetical protein
MPFDRRAATRYRLIEQKLVAEDDSDHELKRLRRVIADLELQLKELDK